MGQGDKSAVISRRLLRVVGTCGLYVLGALVAALIFGTPLFLCWNEYDGPSLATLYRANAVLMAEHYPPDRQVVDRYLKAVYPDGPQEPRQVGERPARSTRRDRHSAG